MRRQRKQLLVIGLLTVLAVLGIVIANSLWCKMEERPFLDMYFSQINVMSLHAGDLAVHAKPRSKCDATVAISHLRRLLADPTAVFPTRAVIGASEPWRSRDFWAVVLAQLEDKRFELSPTMTLNERDLHIQALLGSR